MTNWALSAANFIEKLGPDEPVFCLRARDPIAPQVIDQWALQLEARLAVLDNQEKAGIIPNQDEKQREARREKIADARRTARAMRDWVNLTDAKGKPLHPAKLPD